MSDSQLFFDEIIKYVLDEKPSKDELSKQKIKLCKKHSQKNIPTDIQVLLHTKPEDVKKLNLVSKPTRTISGVCVVAIMSKPQKCPHGECAMCPSNVSDGIPMSYTGFEPATMRGVRNEFDAYSQVFNRLEQYIVLGQPFDKVELIIMGGTFPSFEKTYQENFVTNAYGAMNDFSETFFDKNQEFQVLKFREFFELPHDVREQNKAREIRIKKKILNLKESKKRTLEEEQKKNETSLVRCVGLTVETRPDYGGLKQGNELLRLGCTRVELGVQSVYDKALKKIDRGHTVKDSVNSIKVLKDMGFKLNFHVMPGLPGIKYDEDLTGLKKIFGDENFRPDMLKIYPCMVIPGTKLFKEYKAGKYTPLSTSQAAKMIAEFKKSIPAYCRVMRIQRDIPTYKTTSGVDMTNLRQEIEKHKPFCECIRCREVGHVQRKTQKTPKNVEIRTYQYEASDGLEFFISAEDFEQKILVGFCRLRIPSQSLRKEITNDSAILRELHVYGQATPIGDKGKTQHIGWGKKLLLKAERIAKENNKNKVVIISGVGVRKYYEKLGYVLEGPYMTKKW
ncbi:tRNA uridine(34) 5-carboxymethylaminomethyl modification radical SAM/GNAT enzyme Elp3 [Candidatus Woesearchaeota archaeon]|nr:tRNA uridine(34) 5-carboxymethylaminomethyl modification radical SAM/GNAT enzyme Elp3 [Candidatus Woesearchaeota archaeon]